MITNWSGSASLSAVISLTVPGKHIDPELCVACAEACTFDAIIPGDTYSINGERCDECGSCSEVCSEDAISRSDVM
ncbi:MAG: 4Fe-4S binding protein [Desulforhopalus sp.]|nr:4Fe-4S binding protein [Desulforhopalus sp.]